MKRLFDRTPRRMLIRTVQIVFLRDLNSPNMGAINSVRGSGQRRLPIDPSLHSNGTAAAGISKFV